ncbi:hypothetical protein [Winogradskyella poriferorum]|uniref:hypothetical protein n=1 Tax=Winogradskyella poriferorum TaxID=307627 RepID=UPI003D64A4A8
MNEIVNKDYKLTSIDRSTNLAKSLGLETWNMVLEHVKNLPYGRNSNREDFSLVLKEQKGSCSSKHAILKELADLNEIPNVELILGIYRMDAINTPQIGSVLIDNGLAYIPEAHCYLQIDNERVDLTFKNSDIKNIETAIIVEKIIQPQDVIDYKEKYHKTFIKNWLTDSDLPLNIEELWNIRERCIDNITQ